MRVLFRDTAHGLLAWAVATVVIGAVALSIAGSSIGAASDASVSAATYATDTALRSSRPSSEANDVVRSEVFRLFSHEGGLQGDDRSYLAGVVAQQTGLPRAEAERRIDAADTSIRAGSRQSAQGVVRIGFFTALSMLIGAFIAAVAALMRRASRQARRSLIVWRRNDRGYTSLRKGHAGGVVDMLMASSPLRLL